MTITLFGLPFQASLIRWNRKIIVSRKPHLRCITAADSVWTLPGSIAFTNGISYWFLFLPLLRCFNSGRSQLWLIVTLTGNRIPIRKSQVHWLLASTLSLSQLGTSFISSWAEPSTCWRNTIRLTDFSVSVWYICPTCWLLLFVFFNLYMTSHKYRAGTRIYPSFPRKRLRGAL